MGINPTPREIKIRSHIVKGGMSSLKYEISKELGDAGYISVYANDALVAVDYWKKPRFWRYARGNMTFYTPPVDNLEVIVFVDKPEEKDGEIIYSQTLTPDEIKKEIVLEEWRLTRDILENLYPIPHKYLIQGLDDNDKVITRFGNAEWLQSNIVKLPEISEADAGDIVYATLYLGIRHYYWRGGWHHIDYPIASRSVKVRIGMPEILNISYIRSKNETSITYRNPIPHPIILRFEGVGVDTQKMVEYDSYRTITVHGEVNTIYYKDKIIWRKTSLV